MRICVGDMRVIENCISHDRITFWLQSICTARCYLIQAQATFGEGGGHELLAVESKGISLSPVDRNITMGLLRNSKELFAPDCWRL